MGTIHRIGLSVSTFRQLYNPRFDENGNIVFGQSLTCVAAKYFNENKEKILNAVQENKQY